MVLVDANVLLDILTADSEWTAWSQGGGRRNGARILKICADAR